MKMWVWLINTNNDFYLPIASAYHHPIVISCLPTSQVNLAKIGKGVTLSRGLACKLELVFLH